MPFEHAAELRVKRGIPFANRGDKSVPVGTLELDRPVQDFS